MSYILKCNKQTERRKHISKNMFNKKKASDPVAAAEPDVAELQKKREEVQKKAEKSQSN